MQAEELAYRLNGGGDGPVEMFDQLVKCVREVSDSEPLDRWLAGRLTTVDIVELASSVAMAEPDYVIGEPIAADHDPGDGTEHGLVLGQNRDRARGLRSEEAKRAVTLMYLRGFEPGQIALILVLPEARVRTHLQNVHYTQAARQVVPSWFDGKSASQIAEDTGLARSTVYEVLERAGCKPHRLTTPDELRDKAVRLRAKGLSYEQIRTITGLSTNVLRKTFQRAAKRGLLPNYGKAS